MLDPHTHVARLVLDHAETAEVFHSHHIDFCCHGDVSLAEVCKRRGLDVQALLSELELTIAEQSDLSPVDPRTLSTPDLIDQIVVRHHGYLRNALPYLGALATTVACVHGKEDDRLHTVDQIVARLTAELGDHLDREERALFPELLAASSRGENVAAELDLMLAEHRSVGAQLARLRRLTDDFAVPDWACSTYRALLTELFDLEADLYRHVHLENYVLMPRFASS